VKLPTRLTLRNSAFALDGGTSSLKATDEAGRHHGVMLVQPSRPEASPSFDAVPGRLYFDGQLVPIRSQQEATILSLLKLAEVRYEGYPPFPGETIRLSPNALILGDDIREVFTRGPEDNIRALTAKVVAFVESDEYLFFADRVQQGKDDTRYAVWVVWDDATFGKAVVKVKQLLGVGLKEARDHVQQERPVATGLRAPEVVEWARKFREADLDVRTEPAFRWRLL
jgi:ribosomal protein L7/L12